MTSSIQAYQYVCYLIDRADSYFAMKICDQAINHFGVCFTELKKQKGELIDRKCDRWHELFNKPNIQIKNQNHDKP